MLGTSRTRLFFSNSRSSWGTFPNPLISSSNRVPSPISPGDSLRALGVVGIAFGKVRDVDHALEYLLNGFVYDLDAFDYSHGVPLALR
jgi:hypothetical protein